ncbi:MAG TPA: hypothetical protein VIM75_00160 [Ohtaekwangia sp.]|uniref:hypothetical protein n=1 Tax=Ohtaekwangia sp. TaxID=2066019 RepID=UPI002F95087E
MQAGLAQQVDSTDVSEPEGGLSKLAARYYKIRFTTAQRKILQDLPIEFMYSVDANGNATLEDIRGIDDQAILDSLVTKSIKLPRFQQRIVNGTAESYIYFMKLTFPTYNLSNRRTTYFQRPLTIDDFESIERSHWREDVLISGAANAFAGNASEYLRPGGGFRMEFMYMNEKTIGAGLVMSLYGNSLKKDYPIVTSRAQNNAPPTMFVGGAINKTLVNEERRKLHAQLELCYALQNIVSRDNANSDYLQLKGFSPALTAHYEMAFGKARIQSWFGKRPALVQNMINFHASARPVFFNLHEASGFMFELGIGYRLGIYSVVGYELKPQ